MQPDGKYQLMSSKHQIGGWSSEFKSIPIIKSAMIYPKNMSL